MDTPGTAFYEELVEKYPDAKVILTVRDPDRWYESTLNTIYRAHDTFSSPVFSMTVLFVPGVWNMKRATGIVDDLAWEDTFGGRLEDRRHAIEVFERLNAQVEERGPAERLLVYDVKQGWEPLCEFLGVELPKDEWFPHLSDTDTFRKLVRRRSTLVYAMPVVAILLVASAVLCLRKLSSRLPHRMTASRVSKRPTRFRNRLDRTAKEEARIHP